MQQIGLKHYDDFNERMSREEVEEIETRVSASIYDQLHCNDSYIDGKFKPSAT